MWHMENTYAYRMAYPDGRVFGYHNDRGLAARKARRFGAQVQQYLFGAWREVGSWMECDRCLARRYQ